jgi:hypothetical protein
VRRSLQHAAGASVPVFNAYPLAAVTNVGEYLMSLPQQLEVLLGGAGGPGEGAEQQQQQQQVEEEEGDELAAEWLDKVSGGVGVLMGGWMGGVGGGCGVGGWMGGWCWGWVSRVCACARVVWPPVRAMSRTQTLQMRRGCVQVRLADVWSVARACSSFKKRG